MNNRDEQTFIHKSFAIPESKYTFRVFLNFFFIQGDTNKYALYMFCYSKLFKQYFANY